MNKSYMKFSLTTLQLPAPSSNLTKAEYKDTYGIDLDSVNIPSFKLVVYGKDKFPIDQIKEIEDGYEIYFNGRVLSITDIVQTSNEIYDIVNAKPIYIHPISLVKSVGDVQYSLACLIFNNSAERFTFTTFKAYLNNLYNIVGSEVQIVMTGYYKNDSNSGVVSYLFKGTVNVGIAGYDLTSGTIKALVSSDIDSVLGTANVDFVDGVNKIN